MVYKTPESNLDREESVMVGVVPYGGFYSRSMKFALAILITIQMLLSTITLLDGNSFDWENLMFSFLVSTVHVLSIVFFVGKLRGVEVWKLGEECGYRELSVWGYVWRCWIVSFLATMISLLVLVGTGVSNNIESPSLELTFISGGIVLIFVPFVVWLLFSTNRKLQFNWVVGLFRGY